MSKLAHALVAPKPVMMGLLIFVLPLLVGVKSRAQFTNPITTTPAFLQDGFGPAGDLLPYGGQEYCCPTAVAMSLSYLGVNGFNQIGLASPSAASELNMVQVLSGLMSTSATTGTFTNGLETGIQVYLAAAGIGTANYTLSVTNSPTVSALAGIDQPGTVVDLIGGYYNSSGVRTGGHCIALVGQAVNAQGQSSPNTIVINNPLPGALTPNADVTGNVLQYLNTVPTSGNLTGDGAIELDKTQYPGFWSGNPLVLETAIALTVNPSQQSVNNPTLTAWNLSTTQIINLNSGTLPVLTSVTGAGGISLGSFGLLQMQAADTSTGGNTVKNGTWKSTISLGQPFGSGSIALISGTLQLSPVSGSAIVSLSAASASGNTLTFSNGSVIALGLNGHTSLSFTIGGNTDAAASNLIRSGAGTLVIAPAGGTSDLGQAERVIINGSSGNLPQTTNGIAAPYIVAQNNDSFASGDFVGYGASGFAKAAYTTASSTPIGSAGSNAVFLADVNQTVAASATVQVYALNAGSATIGGGSSSVLKIGTQTGGQAGIILNGGTISTTNVAFGSAEGTVYASSAGGTISSIIQGSNGLTTFGPGTLTITGANTYTGSTNINSGIFLAQNTSGSATGSGSINVQPGATLEISGASAKAGGSGTTTVNTGAAVMIVGGSLSGTLVTNSGSYLFGSGTVTGAATISGTIGTSGVPSQLPSYTGVENINFTSNTTFNSSTIYAWKLNALDATSADAGTNWSLLQFGTGHNNGGSTNLGINSSNAFSFTIDFGSSVPNPDSGNAFWNASHQWLVAEDPNEFNEIWWNSSFPAYSQGSFSLSLNAQVSDLFVNYTPFAVPEPGGFSLLALGAGALLGRRRRRAV